MLKNPKWQIFFVVLWVQIAAFNVSVSIMLRVFAFFFLTNEFRYSYYTAGSGGAGPTILATSFLLLGEETIVYVDGKSTPTFFQEFYKCCSCCNRGCVTEMYSTRMFNQSWLFSGKEQRLKAYSARRDVDFGRGIGKKPVYLLYVLFPLCSI